jgi:hypothetical protein
MASTYDITIDKGATFSLTLNWKDGDGAPVNLAYCTARMQIRKTIKDAGDPYFTLTTENGGIVLGGADGSIALTISATDTAATPATRGVYDLEIVNLDGVVTRLLSGDVEFTLEVTR